MVSQYENIRQGSSSIPSTDSIIRRMLLDSAKDSYEDNHSLVQELSFEVAAKRFQAADLAFGISQQRTLGIIGHNETYTNVGLLVSDQCVHTIKFALFQGKDKLQFLDRVEFERSLLHQLEDCYSVIKRYNRTQSYIDGLNRVDLWDYPLQAVREALLNALVHRDYSYSDSTLISMFEDRIEFLSLGGLVNGASMSDILLGASVLRNPKLAQIFYRLQLVESYGTGIFKILSAYEGLSIQPKIEVSENAFKITLPNMRYRESETELHESESLYGNRFDSLFVQRPAISRSDVERAFGVSQAQAVRIIKRALEQDLIRKVGQGKLTRYVKA